MIKINLGKEYIRTLIFIHAKRYNFQTKDARAIIRTSLSQITLPLQFVLVSCESQEVRHWSIKHSNLRIIEATTTTALTAATTTTLVAAIAVLTTTTTTTTGAAATL